MYRNVVRYVMHCRECQRRKSVPQRPPGRLVPIPPAIAPFHRIGIDLLGRFPKSAHGNKWIIVCTDYSTRYAITKALPTAEVDEIAKFLLEEIVLRHGAPRVIITDQPSFDPDLFPLSSTCVTLIIVSQRRIIPQTNGLTERFNKTLADMLSMYVDVEQKNWDEILPFVTFAYNTAKQETTAARAEESRQLARVHTLSSRQRSSTLRFQTPNGVLRSRRSRMGLYSSEKSRSLEKLLRSLLAVRMTSHNRLDYSLRWEVVGRLEAGQFQADVARSLQVARKWSSSCRINSKQMVLCQESQPRSSQSVNICIGSLLGLKHTTT
ncbi:retrovirus-related Pol polyprotein from transposon 412 [Trichonephila clavipes]|nr:retrovirus-related Pol polyprotein from transposon 412 [Trichonephila clavipes]